MHDVMNYYRIPFNMTCIFEKVKGAIKCFCDIVIYGINRYLQSPLVEFKATLSKVIYIFFIAQKHLTTSTADVRGRADVSMRHMCQLTIVKLKYCD